MNSEPLDSDSPLHRHLDQLPLGKHEPPPANVPVYNCVVYVSPHVEGGVQARVGNLAGFLVRAGSEREALGLIVKAFKQKLLEKTASDKEIPWIDPPDPPAADEQTRYIPVHL